MKELAREPPATAKGEACPGGVEPSTPTEDMPPPR
jgi:hypothetical protein